MTSFRVLLLDEHEAVVADLTEYVIELHLTAEGDVLVEGSYPAGGPNANRHGGMSCPGCWGLMVDGVSHVCPHPVV